LYSGTWDAVMREENRGQKLENKLCCVNHLLGSAGEVKALHGCHDVSSEVWSLLYS
jgi:hypothetical protein